MAASVVCAGAARPSAAASAASSRQRCAQKSIRQRGSPPA